MVHKCQQCGKEEVNNRGDLCDFCNLTICNTCGRYLELDMVNENGVCNECASDDDYDHFGFNPWKKEK